VNGRDVGPGLGREERNASLAPSGIGRQSPAKQNHSSAALVNFHLGFGDFAPVNSKKCDAGTRQRPFGNFRPSERKLMTGAPLGLAGAKPQRNPMNLDPSSVCRMTGAVSVGQDDALPSCLGAADALPETLGSQELGPASRKAARAAARRRRCCAKTGCRYAPHLGRRHRVPPGTGGGCDGSLSIQN